MMALRSFIAETWAIEDGVQQATGLDAPDTQGLVEVLQACILEAKGWVALEHAMERINEVHRNGQLGDSEAQRLVSQVVQRSREVPLSAVKEDGMSIFEVQETKPCCQACGKDVWWYKGSEKICGVCHPSPSAEIGQSGL